MTKTRISMFRLGMVWCVLFLGWVGVACSPKEVPKGPCKTAVDCAGSTICDNGKCVYPKRETPAQEKQTEVKSESSQEVVVGPDSGKESVDASESTPEVHVETVKETPRETGQVCKTGDTKPCYTGPKGTKGKGECRAGKQKCVGGFWDTACVGEVLPSREECNGKDDNCNEKTDESFPQDGDACKLAGKKGPCAKGTYICQADKLVCNVTYKSKPEDCSNKIDDDCDGKIDGPPCKCNPKETRECFSGAPKEATEGECRKGRQTCDAKGQWGACLGEKLPQTETCNGKDDDCDGKVDESFPEKGKSCTDTTKKGICKQGSYTACKGGTLVCTSQVQPAPKEICGNGKDDNCNGDADENPPCQCKPSQTRSCYNGTPTTEKNKPCQRGTQKCDRKGKWGACIGEVTPKSEICDNIDNDCNGLVDDNLKRACSSVCGKGTETCYQGKYIKCTAPQPTAEICDGKDNDCDGYIDNQKNLQQSYSLTQSCSNRCGKGTETCSSTGKWVSCSAPKPTTEICDGKDNDCDGTPDDNVFQVCFDTKLSGCTYNRIFRRWLCKGVCRTGKKVCTAGVYSKSCVGDVGAVTEVCRDGLDNDCDGATDEICGGTFPYASVTSTGSFLGRRYFTAVKKTATGTYALASSLSGLQCDKMPLFLTPATNARRPVSYTCSGRTFIINMGAHATLKGTKQDSSFYAVLPRREADTTWGVASCTGSRTCYLSRSYGGPSLTQVGTGIVDITSTRCKNATGPLFATILSSSLTGYATAYYYNGKCRVRTYGLDGKLAIRSFSFWAPNPKTAAWSVISSTGSVIAQNNFGDSRAKWKSKFLSSGSLLYYDVFFPAWSRIGAALVQPRVGTPIHTPALPTSGGIRVYSRYLTSTQSKATTFSVMFVQ